MEVKRNVDPKWLENARDLVEREHGAGVRDEHFLRGEHFRAALADPAYRRLSVLFGDRIVATRPHRTLYATLTRVGQFNVVKPQGITERIKTNKEYVLEATVLRTGTGVHPDDVRAGDRVIVSQFAGSVWHDAVNGRETELWLFGTGDVILKLTPENGERRALDDVIDNCIQLLNDAMMGRNEELCQPVGHREGKI